MPSRRPRTLPVAALALLVVPSTVSARAPEPPPVIASVQPGASTIRASALGVELVVHTTTLANGLRVYAVEDHSTPAFSLHTVFDVGGRDEEPGHSGLAHLFEHMMFKGSANVPEGGHFGTVFRAGGRSDAFTTADYTEYLDELPSNYLDTALWLEADRLRSLAITDENFENQRAAVQEERAMRFENVAYAAPITTFFAEVWQGSGYGHLLVGLAADLEAATANDARAFFAKHYAPNHAVLAIVGDVDPAEVFAKVERYYGDIPRGADKPARAAVDHTPIQLERRIPDPLATQPLYVLGWKTVPQAHADRPALDLLGRALVGGDSATLTRILVDEKRLAVAVFGLPENATGGADAGALVLGVIPTPGVGLATIRSVVEAEIAAIRSKGLSRKELQKAANQRTVETIESLATNRVRASLVAEGALLRGSPTIVLTDLEKVQEVTPADIKRVASQYLTDRILVLEVVPST